MAYSHARLRNTLALVRVITGVVFIILGEYKISSLEFARIGFPQFIWDATHGTALGFYADFLGSFVWQRMGTYAVLIGFVELFIGVGLTLGLAVRPISILGMLYMVNLMLATWMAPGPGEALSGYLDAQLRHLVPLLLFLVLGVGHAGENWGFGSLYHRRRHVRWEQQQSRVVDGNNPEPTLTDSMPGPQPSASGSPVCAVGKDGSRHTV
jgi:uncharacterized membrane protein YphA (DoxX/SURF4 family)